MPQTRREGAARAAKTPNPYKELGGGGRVHSLELCCVRATLSLSLEKSKKKSKKSEKKHETFRVAELVATPATDPSWLGDSIGDQSQRSA